MKPHYVVMGRDSNELLYGMVDAESDHEASTTVLKAVGMLGGVLNRKLYNQIFFWMADPGWTQIVHRDQLVDGRWRQVGPYHSIPAGDVAGARQLSWARMVRFLKALPDGTWAMYIVSYYVAQTSQPGSQEKVMECMQSYTICDNPMRPEATSRFQEYRYTEFPWAATEVEAKRLADEYSIVAVTWTGEPFQGSDIPRQGITGRARWFSAT